MTDETEMYWLVQYQEGRYLQSHKASRTVVGLCIELTESKMEEEKFSTLREAMKLAGITGGTVVVGLKI